MLWLAIGNQPQVKGFDRTLDALEVFSDARLIVAGIGQNSKAGRKLWRMAGRLGLRDRVRLLGVREDIPELMAAADLLVHPARTETTGTVILEAIVNGLPVVASSACGYAAHVAKADAGLVVAEPFSQAAFIEHLREAQTAQRLEHWSSNAIRYGETADLYRGLSQAASIIAGKA
jgi:UDP-glucose:(heptosyl)LPS alpha-1,3-glucosyltransferase